MLINARLPSLNVNAVARLYIMRSTAIIIIFQISFIARVRTRIYMNPPCMSEPSSQAFVITSACHVCYTLHGYIMYVLWIYHVYADINLSFQQRNQLLANAWIWNIPMASSADLPDIEQYIQTGNATGARVFNAAFPDLNPGGVPRPDGQSKNRWHELKHDLQQTSWNSRGQRWARTGGAEDLGFWPLSESHVTNVGEEIWKKDLGGLITYETKSLEIFWQPHEIKRLNIGYFLKIPYFIWMQTLFICNWKRRHIYYPKQQAYCITYNMCIS